MSIAADVPSADAVAARAADRADDRGRRLFWLALVVVEIAWLSAIAYGLSVLLG